MWLNAERHFSATWWFHKIVGDEVRALQSANRATADYRLHPTYRMQLALSMNALMKSGRRVRVDDAVMDRVHEIASSASPYHPAVLALRAEWLINTDRFNEELSEIIERLRRDATLQPEAQKVVRFYDERVNGN